MALPQSHSFLRLPNQLLDVLLRTRLTGTQFRILLWVLRRTYGWNKEWTPFTWYRIAKELCLDRPVVYRAGKVLLETKVLVLQDRQLAVQIDYSTWTLSGLKPTSDDVRQLWIPGTTVACEQRRALSGN